MGKEGKEEEASKKRENNGRIFPPFFFFLFPPRSFFRDCPLIKFETRYGRSWIEKRASGDHSRGVLER